jgi:hypothetical protein
MAVAVAAGRTTELTDRQKKDFPDSQSLKQTQTNYKESPNKKEERISSSGFHE